MVLQSCEPLEPCPAARPPFVALMVGHLRDVKDPRTFFRAVRRLGHRGDLAFHHIGEALDDALGAEARALAAHAGVSLLLASCVGVAATLAGFATSRALRGPGMARTWLPVAALPFVLSPVVYGASISQAYDWLGLGGRGARKSTQGHRPNRSRFQKGASCAALHDRVAG